VRETVRAFVDALRAGASPPISFSDGLRAVAIAEACYAAARSGRETAVEAVDARPESARGAA